MQEIFPPARADSPVMHQCIFAEGWPHLFPQSRWEWETQKFPPRKKVGVVFYIPDFMEIQTPRAFPNCPERWRDNLESAEDFSPARADSPVMHQCIFAEGWPHLFPQSRWEWETQKFPPRKKVGVVFYIPDFMEIQTPRAFPNCPERWRDNLESAEDFSPARADSPVMHRRIFAAGRLCSLPPIPNGMGIQNSHFFCKRWE